MKGQVAMLQFGVRGVSQFFECRFNAEVVQLYKHVPFKNPNHFQKTKVILDEMKVDHVESILEQYRFAELEEGGDTHILVLDATESTETQESKLKATLRKAAVYAGYISRYC